MNKKVLFIGGGALAVVAIVVALFFIFMGGEDAYRSIKVFEIDGSCKVERGGDSLDAFKNMALSSGDSLTVGEGSFARLKLDDDKYVYLEANTKINLTATGTANDSKTMVYIERGSMLTEVKKKLSATSSYDIVTPNTTMSIRGTKTLTEVYEDVLGAIKTNAAVVEGQVSFKTIQKDSTGKAVIVTTDLSVGQGLGVTTDSKDLLSQEDIKHIVDDGKTVDGQVAEETTHEELGTTLETPVFSEDFLTNIVAVLARSREEDIEEGFTAEDVTEEELNAAINVLNDVIDGKVEIPAAVEEYVISQAQPYYDEPIVYDTPITGGNDDTTPAQQSVESEPEQITDDTVIPEDSEDAGDDTFVVDGTGETLVGIGDDTDDNDAVVADDESDDEADAADDEADDETADDGSDEAEEDDKSDEGDDSAEDGDEEDTEDESDEDGEDKEDAEETEDEDKEEESEESEDETEEQQEETAVQQPGTSETDPGAQGGSTGTQDSASESTATNVTFSYGSTTAYVSAGSSSDDTRAIALSFYEVTSSGGNPSGRHNINEGELPTTVAVGSALPGTQNSPIHVEVGEQWSDQYEFEGWYISANGARDLNQSEKVTVAQSGITSLYPGVKEKKFTVTITNLFTRAGQLYIPDSYTDGVAGADGITYTYDSNEGGNRIVISGIPYGYELLLPVAADNLNQTYESLVKNSRPYVLSHDLHEGMQMEQDQWEYYDTPKYLGIGSSDNLSLSDIMPEYYNGGDAAYQANVVDTGKFIPGDFEDQASLEGIKKVITGNCNLSLYFAVKVTMEINAKLATDLSTMQFRYNDGSTQMLSEIVNSSIGYGFTYSGIVEFGDGTIWNCDIANGIVTANTYYYGKHLCLPQVRITDISDGYDLMSMMYLKKSVEHYTYPIFRGVTSFNHANLQGDSAGDPLPDLINGKVWYTSMLYSVVLTEYAVLDLSESGVEIKYLNSDGVIRDTSLENQNKLKIESFYEEGAWWISLPTWYNTDTENEWWNTYPYWETSGSVEPYYYIKPQYSLQDQYSIPIGIKKNGYRVIGYDIGFTDNESNTHTERRMIGTDYNHDAVELSVDSYGNVTLTLDYLKLGYYNPKNVVITPIFVIDKPFTTTVMRKNNNMAKSTATNPNSSKWAYSDYVTVLEGPGLIPDAGGYPFVTDIIASTLYSVDYAGVADFVLIPTLRWNPSSNAYLMMVYDPSQGMYVASGFSYTPVNGRIEIPWSDLVEENYLHGNNTYGFFRGAKFYDDTPQSGQNSKYGVYFTSAMFGDQTILRVKPDGAALIGEEEWQTFPCEIPDGSETLYTGVIVDDPLVNNETMLTAVFNENTDVFNTAGDFLKLISGRTDLKQVWFGGKLFAVEGAYSGSITPTLITRETTGLAKTIIHGTEPAGSGLLKFMPVDRIEVTNKNDAVMYPYGDYEFVNGSIQLKSGITTDTFNYASVIDEYNEPSYPLVLSKSTESTLPNGWVVVDYRNQGSEASYYYIYIGDDVNVTGRAEVEFKTEWG